LDNWKSNIAIALIAASSATAGSLITGNYLLKSNAQQIDVQKNQFQAELKVRHIENLIKLSSEYSRSLDELINVGLTQPDNEEKLIASISSVQLKGTELILITNDEIAQIINSANYYAVLYLQNRKAKESQDFLSKLGKINTTLIKSLRLFIQENRGNPPIFSTRQK
jgi:hypothetical protein